MVSTYFQVTRSHDSAESRGPWVACKGGNDPTTTVSRWWDRNPLQYSWAVGPRAPTAKGLICPSSPECGPRARGDSVPCFL